MSVTPGEPSWLRAAAWSARHPLAAIALAAVISLLALLGLRRVHADASIGSMLAKDDPAAAAMLRVLDHFSAVDDLIVLGSVPSPQPASGQDATRLIAYAQRLEAA